MLFDSAANAYLESLQEKLIQSRRTSELTAQLGAGWNPLGLVALEDQFAREVEADRRYVEARNAFCRALSQ